MTQKRIEGLIYYDVGSNKYCFDTFPKVVFEDGVWKGEYVHYIFVCDYTLSFELPENFNTATPAPEPMKYDGKRDDQYVTGWNDCLAGMLAADPKFGAEFMKEQSLFEEDYPPTGGAGFMPVEPVTIDEVFDVLAGRDNTDRNGRGYWYWFNQIVVNSNLAELPITVVAEIVHNAAAHNDGSHQQMRGYLEDILTEEGLI